MNLPGFGVMGVRHQNHTVEEVQLHPESSLTEVGHDILTRFLSNVIASRRRGKKRGNLTAKGKRSNLAYLRIASAPMCLAMTTRIDIMAETIYLNGYLILGCKAVLAPFAHGFLYG